MTRKSIHTTCLAHHHLEVSGMGERIYFDLLLPRKAVAFTSITILAGAMKSAATAATGRTWQDSTAGHVALRWNQPGDVFFMQRVDLLETFERDYTPSNLTHPGGAFWQAVPLEVSGTRMAPATISIPWACRRVRGAYIDEINQARGAAAQYSIDIHLTYTKHR